MKKIFLISLIFFSQLYSNNFDTYKWASLVALPIIYSKLAINSILKASRNTKIEESYKVINIPVKTDNIVQNIELRIPKNLNLFPTNFDDTKTKKCVLCQAVESSTKYSLLTYGSITNLLDRIIKKDPGTFTEIGLKPVVNAVLMYASSFLINKIAKYKLLND